MTPLLVVGVDLSTSRLDLVAIPVSPEIVLTPEHARIDVPDHRLPRAQGGGLDSAARCAWCGVALRATLDHLGPDVVAVALENPIGQHRNTDRALLPILGALTYAAQPPGAAWYWANEWRALVGATGRATQTKAGGHDAIRKAHGFAVDGLDEAPPWTPSGSRSPTGTSSTATTSECDPCGCA